MQRLFESCFSHRIDRLCNEIIDPLAAKIMCTHKHRKKTTESIGTWAQRKYSHLRLPLRLWGHVAIAAILHLFGHLKEDQSTVLVFAIDLGKSN